jgi:hypothetical protein
MILLKVNPGAHCSQLVRGTAVRNGCRGNTIVQLGNNGRFAMLILLLFGLRGSSKGWTSLYAVL